MAQRLATEYKQIVLELNSQQLQGFINLFKMNNFSSEIRVYENGDTEFILFDNGNEIPLAFRNMGLFFEFKGSYIITDLQLAHTMRKAIRDFKGNAIVNRLYNGYSMEYHYEHGIVMKIVECKKESQTVIYQYEDTVGKLTRLFAKQGVEDQIAWVRLQIDLLLDQRKKTQNMKTIAVIDQQLGSLSRELISLEA